MVPPISITNRLQIARPSPVPPYRRDMELSICENVLNNRVWASGGMPMPVSATSNRNDDPSAVTRSSTCPRAVNFHGVG
jgi:hypothetical protein